VVLDFSSNANLQGYVVLHGLTPDQVLWNFVDGSGRSGGPTASLNNNASSFPTEVWQGILLDPNGTMSLVNANLTGRVSGAILTAYKSCAATPCAQHRPIRPGSPFEWLYSLPGCSELACTDFRVCSKAGVFGDAAGLPPTSRELRSVVFQYFRIFLITKGCLLLAVH